jgi:carbon-monoxide dehydrogenase medium subunit
MKPVPFQYFAPREVDEALERLAEFGDEAKLLAGGQSLVPAMNFRLVRPGAVVDLNRVLALSYLEADASGLRIGAMARQRTLERAAEVRRGWPLLAEAIGYVGHPAIRNQGTVGGSLAHADPAAELPAVMRALDATFVVRDRSGQREVAAADFFISYLTTCLTPTELLVEIRVPRLPARTGWAFHEVSRRHGDFALVGVGALLTLAEDGVIAHARLAFTGAGPAPIRATQAEQSLVGQPAGEEAFRAAAAAAALVLDPVSDIHASADYRREVGAALARRALAQAAGRSANGSAHASD